MEINALEIKKFMKKNNLTYKEFADICNVSTEAVRKWINGGTISAPKKQLLASVLGNNYGIIGNGNKNNTFDNRQYYSDSPDVLRHQIDMLEERIKEKDAQIKEKDAQIKEKDAQIKDQAKQIFELIKKIKC